MSCALCATKSRRLNRGASGPLCRREPRSRPSKSATTTCSVYFIEITQTHADKIETGAGSPFIHRQTMAGAMRFTTVELNELEAKITSAADKALALELGLFETLVKETTGAGHGNCRLRGAPWQRSMSRRRWRSWRFERRYCRPVVDQSARFCGQGRPPTRSSRRRWPKPAGSAFVAKRLRFSARQDAGAGGGKRGVALDRTQHGRQVDLPAPETR